MEVFTKLINLGILAVSTYWFFFLANFYLTLKMQFIVGWILIVTLFILGKIEKFKKPPLRIVFVVLSVFLSVRYLIWRTFDTLVYENPWDFTGTILVYGAELYAITIHFMGIFANIWPEESKITPLPEDISLYPSVDIFIPTYSEPIDMVRMTATSAANIDYPKNKLNIHILDDGGTVAKRCNPDTQLAWAAWERYYELKRVAAKLGINYITRERNIKAKAGNLNHAFSHTTSDLVLVLDCDHVPTRDILKNITGGFLRDPKLAFVQTPHFFVNQGPIEKNIDILSNAPSESDLFYRASHPGLNSWNSSFFCGSAAILRRKHLEEVNGFSGETITEDCETAFALHSKGYNSVFISRPMVCGLSPETFDDFILQRSRWAQGMTQILILNSPLFAKGLKFYQRICYLNNSMYWFFGISRFIFMVAPALFLLVGMHVFYASVTQVLAYALPHLISSILIMDFFYGKYRWPFLSDLYENVQSVFLLPVVFSVLANPRKPSFKVTPKGKSLENAFLSGLALPFFLMCLVLIAAIPAAINQWITYPIYRDVITVSLSWCMFNLSLSIAGFGAFFERRQIRRHHRTWATGKLSVYLPRLKTTVDADTEDISISGIGLAFRLEHPLVPLETIEIEARDSYGERYKIEARIQRIRQKGDLYSCGSEFTSVNSDHFVTSVKFVYGDSQRWVDYWSRKANTANPLIVLWFVLKMAKSGFKTFFVAFFELFFAPFTRFVKYRLNKLQAQKSGAS